MPPIHSGVSSVGAPSRVAQTRTWLGANHQRLLKFAGVGLSGVGVNLAIFELCYRVVLPGVLDAEGRLLAANAAGLSISILTNFLLNDLWTWSDRRKGGRVAMAHRLLKYYVSASLAGAVQLLVTSASFALVWQSLALPGVLEGRGPTLSVMTGIGAGMTLNFLASHFWTFRDVPPNHSPS